MPETICKTISIWNAIRNAGPFWTLYTIASGFWFSSSVRQSHTHCFLLMENMRLGLPCLIRWCCPDMDLVESPEVSLTKGPLGLN